ncbi:MAG: DUF86 domain-containing protein [Candidatus Korarchaeota archaeon]|nr:DUF86 domain-containing protein [Candidatus Korarchaeota archaeon]NIU85309.1 DUF86 domain-containing protein [Candidatus Thorarchaeota archaeon]NIW15409.1 DUF86 domain-containing protein [Candidatus Thorarchaeota archaeon]NIW53353.1 DUF86 domain-containing protein [Candidatus Korarchaeota archaeon]
MIDQEIIESRFDIIEENMKYLQKVQKVEYFSFAENFEKIQAVKHSLQECIEACIDVANHLISALILQRADTYTEMFLILSQNEIISHELAKKLAEMAKFRNLLVHRYADIDTKRLYNILQRELTDIQAFMREISRYLDNKT